MRENVAPPWSFILFAVICLAVIATTAATGSWFIASLAGACMVAISGPSLLGWAVAALRGPGEREGLAAKSLLSFSKAQRIAAGGAIAVPFLIWRALAVGWVPVAVVGPVLGIYAVWLVMVVRSEGWSGDKARDS